jgi:hypothetical protein
MGVGVVKGVESFDCGRQSDQKSIRIEKRKKSRPFFLPFFFVKLAHDDYKKRNFCCFSLPNKRTFAEPLASCLTFSCRLCTTTNWLVFRYTQPTQLPLSKLPKGPVKTLFVFWINNYTNCFCFDWIRLAPIYTNWIIKNSRIFNWK